MVFFGGVFCIRDLCLCCVWFALYGFAIFCWMDFSGDFEVGYLLYYGGSICANFRDGVAGVVLVVGSLFFFCLSGLFFDVRFC